MVRGPEFLSIYLGALWNHRTPLKTFVSPNKYMGNKMSSIALGGLLMLQYYRCHSFVWSNLFSRICSEHALSILVVNIIHKPSESSRYTLSWRSSIVFFLFSISSLIKSWILKTINTLNIEINIIKCLHHNSNYIYWKFDRPFYKTLTWTRRCQCGEVIWIQLWICVIHNTILLIIIAKPCIIVVVNVVVFLLVKFEIIRM